MIILLILIWLTLVLIYYRLHTLVVAIDHTQKSPVEMIKEMFVPKATIIYPKSRKEKAIDDLISRNAERGEETLLEDLQ